MKFVVTGETIETNRKVFPEEFVQVLKKGIVLNLEAYNNLGFKKKISPNGTAKTKTGVAIVDVDSADDAKRLLANAPSWFKVNWSVTPLENF